MTDRKPEMHALRTFIDAVKRGYQEEALRAALHRTPRKDRSEVLLIDADDVADVIATTPPASMTRNQARGYRDVNHPVLWHEFRGRTLRELRDDLLVREQVESRQHDRLRADIAAISARRQRGGRGQPPRRLVQRVERRGATLARLHELRTTVESAISPHTDQA